MTRHDYNSSDGQVYDFTGRDKDALALAALAAREASEAVRHALLPDADGQGGTQATFDATFAPDTVFRFER